MNNMFLQAKTLAFSGDVAKTLRRAWVVHLRNVEEDIIELFTHNSEIS